MVSAVLTQVKHNSSEGRAAAEGPAAAPRRSAPSDLAEAASGLQALGARQIGVHLSGERLVQRL